MSELKYGKKFYEAYPGQFSGDVLSSEIIRQAHKYIEGSVLDIGAGSGAMMSCLRKLENVTEVVGIDIAPTKDDIIEASAAQIPLNSTAFDCAIASEVIEHLDDDTLYRSILELYRVLNPRGYLIITTPYKDDLTRNQVMCPHCGQHFDRFGHVRSFDKENIYMLLNPFFEVIKIRTVSLGFMNAHKRLKYIMPILKGAGFFKGEETLFIIAQKNSDICNGWEINDLL